jgi:branched-chain amino acid aminotransferase
MSAAFYGAKFCWMDGKVVETEGALVSAMEPIYLGIFEGIKAYKQGHLEGEGKLSVFSWDQHMDRLWRSAAIDGLKMPYNRDVLLDGLRAVVKANDFKSNIYIQPRIWPRAEDHENVHVVIPVWKFKTLLPSHNPEFSKKRKYMVSSWRRVSSDALPPQAKSWANYANSSLAAREAKRCGYDSALFLDNRGFVSEGTGACVMIVRDGRLITPPVTASILESVTRGLFIGFVPLDLGIPTEVRDLTRSELYAAEEVFLCGTGGEVTPISSVDDIPVGGEYPGPVTRRIADYYSEIIAGNVDKYRCKLTDL